MNKGVGSFFFNYIFLSFLYISIKTEDYERKIREMEAKQEALLKRITEKDKNLNKIR